MTKLKSNEYIVFQPDQVLTSDNLNQLFHYLDQQNRWTRNKLLGMGIVCGLDLVVVNETVNTALVKSIEISKGCGITSEGYLILEKKDKVYTHAIAYSPLVLPPDLPFSCPNLPFYQTVFTDTSNIFKLITCDQFNLTLTNPIISQQTNPCQDTTTTTTTTASTNANGATATAPPQPFALSAPPTGIDLSQYVVVLFWEANEKSLKSCDMQDCNNNGDKMVFNLIPLLVPRSEITDCSGLKNTIGNRRVIPHLPEIKLKRYNVPPGSISNAQDILDAFMAITTTTLIDEVAGAYNYCYLEYNSVLQLAGDPFSPALATNLKNILNGLNNNNPIMAQYFYDYISDLILAYYEFRDVATLIDTQCCANECCFPLHLILGETTKSTNYLVKDPLRQYFIYSPLFDGQVDSLDQLRFYFNRMEILANQFPGAAFPVPKTNSDSSIKITPSQYQDFPLSQRAIPYYYPESKTDANSLYQFWNFRKAINGDSAFNLSYNADKYNSDDSVVTPLLYDIEKYNFFRIEGHLGQTYTAVLTSLLADRTKYNLPFDIVAISSELLQNPTATIPQCNILDLETDYLLLVSEFLCKLYLCLIEILLMNSDGDKTFVQADTTDNTSLVKTYVANFTTSKVTYNPGDFIKVTAPAQGTIGNAYLTSISKGAYSNPITMESINAENMTASKVSYQTYDMLNSTDQLFSTLLNNNMTTISQSTLQSNYDDFTAKSAALRAAASLVPTTGATSDSATTAELMKEFFEDCCCSSLICIFGEFLVLIAEYLRRLKYYEDQLLFLQYYKRHPGLEHKAGVPKGGTFVIVYYPGTPDVTYYNSNNVQDVVFADFYVPYLCCSDCAPVAYIVQPTTTQPSISVAPATPNSIAYCNADTNSYLITTSPAGGIINGPANSVVNGSFLPGNVLTAGIYTLTYTVNQQTVAAYVEVMAPPQADFDYDVDIVNTNFINYRNPSTGAFVQAYSLGTNNTAPSNGIPYINIEVQFINDSLNATSYVWDFLILKNTINSDLGIFVNIDPPATTPVIPLINEPNPKCVYSIPLVIIKEFLLKGKDVSSKISIQASLTASNGVCAQSVITEDLTSYLIDSYPFIALDYAIFLATDKSQYGVQTSATTGTVTGDGVSQVSTGNYQFSPQGLAVGDHILTYTNNGKASTFTATIQASPQPAFQSAVASVQSQPTQISVQFTNTSQNASSYQWSFGDGQTSTDASPTHAYARSFVESKQGVIPVTLNAMNGVYPGVSVTTNVIAEVYVSLPSSVYCNSDSTTSVEPTTNISGGVFSIDGVAVPQSANYKFSPLNMTEGAHYLTYTYNNLSINFQFTINGLPKVALDYDKKVSVTKDGISVTFINKSDNQSTQFTWNFGDGSKAVITKTIADSPVHLYPKKNLKALYTSQQKALAKDTTGANTKTVTVTVTLSGNNNCGTKTASLDVPLDISSFL